MKIVKSLLFALIPFLGTAQSPEEVVAKYLDATEAKGKLEAITTFKYNRSYVANANTDYDEEVVVVGDKGQLSRKKTLLKRDFFYVLNGKEGWVKVPMGSANKKITYNTINLTAKELNELTVESQDGVLPFVNYEAKGYKLSSPVAAATVEGKATTKLAIEKAGIKREFYFDASTGLLTREVLIENGITHTMDINKYDVTSVGAKLPSAFTYINTKDKRKTNVSTKWIFENPTQGVDFTK